MDWAATALAPWKLSTLEDISSELVPIHAPAISHPGFIIAPCFLCRQLNAANLPRTFASRGARWQSHWGISMCSTIVLEGRFSTSTVCLSCWPMVTRELLRRSACSYSASRSWPSLSNPPLSSWTRAYAWHLWEQMPIDGLLSPWHYYFTAQAAGLQAVIAHHLVIPLQLFQPGNLEEVPDGFKHAQAMASNSAEGLCTWYMWSATPSMDTSESCTSFWWASSRATFFSKDSWPLRACTTRGSLDTAVMRLLLYKSSCGHGGIGASFRAWPETCTTVACQHLQVRHGETCCSKLPHGKSGQPCLSSSSFSACICVNRQGVTSVCTLRSCSSSSSSVCRLVSMWWSHCAKASACFTKALDLPSSSAFHSLMISSTTFPCHG